FVDGLVGGFEHVPQADVFVHDPFDFELQLFFSFVDVGGVVGGELGRGLGFHAAVFAACAPVVVDVGVQLFEGFVEFGDFAGVEPDGLVVGGVLLVQPFLHALADALGEQIGV